MTASILNNSSCLSLNRSTLITFTNGERIKISILSHSPKFFLWFYKLFWVPLKVWHNEGEKEIWINKRSLYKNTKINRILLKNCPNKSLEALYILAHKINKLTPFLVKNKIDEWIGTPTFEAYKICSYLETEKEKNISTDFKVIQLCRRLIFLKKDSCFIELGKQLSKGSFRKVFDLYHYESEQNDHVLAIQQLKSTYVKEKKIINILNQNSSFVYSPFQLEINDMAYIAMEKCIDLQTFLKSHTLANYQKIKIFKNIIEAVLYMHDHNIVHRDLKLENIFIKEIDENLSIKIGDFNLSEFASHLKKFSLRNGTRYFFAPEILFKKNIFQPKKIDCWSLGIIFYYLLWGSFPEFVQSIDKKNQEDFEKIIKDELAQLRLPNPLQGYGKIIKGLLEIEPNYRLSVEETKKQLSLLL